MKKRLILSIALIACSLPGASLAQEAAEPVQQQKTEVDPARMAAARSVVAKILPPGSYSELMRQTLGSTTQMALDGVGKVPMRDLVEMGGVSEEKLATLGEGTLAEVMEIYDPHFGKRMDRMMKVMAEDMAALFTKFEPDMRIGMERAYARRFTTEQLSEISRFFETGAGRAYAEQSLMIWIDPEVMEGMQKAMPEMMKAMPAMMTRITEATADLPPPRKFEDLTKAERARLAKILGVSEAELKRRK